MKVCPRCSDPYPDDASFCPECGTELKKSNDPFLGRTISARYRLIKRLGSGGMALVYLARHVIIDRLSAIKVLRQDLGLNPANRERFLREARAVNRINHANIVEITDYGEAEGLAYLVMEYVQGESLLAHIQKGKFPWPRAAHVAHQIALALGRAHQMGVIHRDLKPENVILVAPKNGELELVKLTDFGIAKIIDAPALTFSEQIFGTPGYIPPELVEGIPADGRADLYSLGVVLYEMITALLPYDARTQADLLLKPLSAPPIPPGTRVPGLPPELESLMLQLLARHPGDRPRDAFAVADVLSDTLRRYANPSVKPPPIVVHIPPGLDAIALTIREPVVNASLGDTVVDRVSPFEREPKEEKGRADSVRPSIPLTANVGRMATSEMASRWSSALSDLEKGIVEARKRGGSTFTTDRASELAGVVREMIPRVERAGRVVGDAQSKVDRLEAQGREFRANLGHAIDELVHDRSRERAHLEALKARRGSMDSAPASSGPSSIAETRVWEMAALAAELERAQALDDDLSFQIDGLQKQLDLRNETFDREMVEASGGLEGSLAALRRLTSELVRTIDDAVSIVSGGPRRP